jgi:hypothetical protein
MQALFRYIAAACVDVSTVTVVGSPRSTFYQEDGGTSRTVCVGTTVARKKNSGIFKQMP